MRRIVGCVGIALVLAGCGGKRSSLLLERHARGPLEETSLVASRVAWKLEPVTQSQEQQKVEVSVTFASQEFLKQFFSNREVFGPYAGHNPYFLENLVFYVKIANRSEKRIR